jgi:hypothetical protein
VIITTGRIRRTLVNKINLLVDSPRFIEASRLAPVKAESIFIRRASGCLGTSHGSSRGASSTTSTTPRVRVPRHVARLITRLVAPLVLDYSAYAARPGASSRRVAHLAARRRLLRLRRVSGCLSTSRGSSSTTSTTPCVQVPRHIARLVAPLVVDYFAYAARPGASARRAARHAARRRLLHLRRASGCIGTSCGSSRDSSSTTLPRAGSSSTTSPKPRVRVPRHVARLVTRLVVDYFASRRLVVDYFAYAARQGASARRAARHAARCRLLHQRRASGCFGTSRGSSRDSSSTTSPRAGSSLTTSHPPRVRVPRHVTRLVVDYFDYAARPGSSSTTSPTPRVRVPRHVARLVTRLVVDYFTYVARPVASAHRAARRAARRRLLRLRHVSGCLGTSRGSSRGLSHRSSSTSSHTPRVRVPRHVARLVVDYFASRRLAVDYFDYAVRPGASACRAARHAARLAAHRRQLCLCRASGCLGTARDSSRGSSSTTPYVATSSCGHTCSTSATPCVATTCLAATLALLRVHHAPPRRRLPVTSCRPFISTSFPN